MDDLELILDSFELTERQRQIVEFEVKERELSGFENTYNYVTWLVDFLRSYFIQKREFSLDVVVDKYGDKTDIIAIDDTALSLLIHEEELLETDRITLEDAVYLLKDKLSGEEYACAEFLLQNSAGNKRLLQKPTEIIGELKAIQDRIQQVMEKFYVEGELRLPQHPIKWIKFAPFKIKFQRRLYNGDPLKFFIENEHLYDGLSRSELARVDYGLYMALQKYNQLDDAIPWSRRLNEGDVNRIIESYEGYEGNSMLAAKELGHSPATVRKVWREEGFDIKERRILSEDEISRIIQCHEIAGGVALHAAELCDCSYTTVIRHWKDAGLELAWKFVIEEDVNSIVQIYEEVKGNSSEAGRKLGWSGSTIKKYWEAHGLEASGKGNTLKDEDIESIIEAYYTYDGNCKEAERHLPHKFETIAKYWREEGLELRGRESTRISEKQVQAVLKAHEEYEGNLREAARNLPHIRKTIRDVWTKHGLLPRGHEKYKLSQDTIEQIIDSHTTYEGDFNRVAEEFDCHPMTIKRHWKKAGLSWKDYRQIDRQPILDAYETYDRNATRTACELGHSIVTVLDTWNEAGLRACGKPETKKDLEKEQLFIDAYKTFEGDAVKATEGLPYHSRTILENWKRLGLKSKAKKGRKGLSVEQKSEIILSYVTYEGNCSEAARRMPYHYNTINVVWKQFGLHLAGRDSLTLKPKQIQEIIDCFELSRGSTSKATEMLPYSVSSVIKYWKREGLIE